MMKQSEWKLNIISSDMLSHWHHQKTYFRKKFPYSKNVPDVLCEAYSPVSRSKSQCTYRIARPLRVA